jgi:hypothetical protein
MAGDVSLHIHAFLDPLERGTRHVRWFASVRVQVRALTVVVTAGC